MKEPRSRLEGRYATLVVSIVRSKEVLSYSSAGSGLVPLLNVRDS